MPRVARTVFAHHPHHITQRGNRGEDVFFDAEDRAIYLAWLGEYAAKFKVEVVAYCLMTNHIHLILIPTTEDGLQKLLKPLHMRYAQRLNRLRGQQGHVWQGRYFSSVLDNDYFRAALRYIERNPVRAGMVKKAENYEWSSAAGHCALAKDNFLKRQPAWRKTFADINDWSGWLSELDEDEKLLVLRRYTMMGLPCGSEKFIRKIEKRAGRNLRANPIGRPKKLHQKEGVTR
jgi:putative transposase